MIRARGVAWTSRCASGWVEPCYGLGVVVDQNLYVGQLSSLDPREADPLADRSGYFRSICV